MKCLCPAPDYINVPLPHGMTETILLKGFGTVLHGKKVTCQCEICGQELCDDCRALSVWGLDDWELDWPLCPDCAEVER